MLEIIDVHEPSQWHATLSALPNTHPLQTWTWGEFKSRWGWSMRAVLFEDNGNCIGAAMVLKRPIPYTPFSFLYVPKGPVFDYEDEAVRTAMFQGLETIADQERAILVKVDPDIARAFGEDGIPDQTGTATLNTLSARGWVYSPEQIQFKNTVLYDISRPEDEILASMKQKTRYNIRQGTKKGVTVREGGVDDLPLIFEMYQTTAERDHFLIRPEAYYLDGWRNLIEDGFAVPLIAEFEGQPLGAVIVVFFADRALYMYGASTGAERKRMPNYLLQWEAIKLAKARGCTVYDFWGAPDAFDENDRMWGVYRFKRGFNGTVLHGIGAWDYPAKPLMYRAFVELLPRFRAFLRRGS